MYVSILLHLINIIYTFSIGESTFITPLYKPYIGIGLLLLALPLGNTPDKPYICAPSRQSINVNLWVLFDSDNVWEFADGSSMDWWQLHGKRLDELKFGGDDPTHLLDLVLDCRKLVIWDGVTQGNLNRLVSNKREEKNRNNNNNNNNDNDNNNKMSIQLCWTEVTCCYQAK